MARTRNRGTGETLLSRWRAVLADADRRPRVVLAEGDDPRVLRAAVELSREGLLLPVLVCATPGDARRAAAAGAEVLPACDLAAGGAGGHVADLAAKRGWNAARVTEASRDVLYLAAALVATGEADACVAGAARPSGDVIRAALHMVGLRPGARLLSSSFLLVLPDHRSFAFGDCAVVPEPDQEQLADIAIGTADTYLELTGNDPAVAMLSFSTLGSADHDEVRRVRGATELVRRRAPHLAVDGELQLDAAVVASVAQEKAAGSAVAGHANVLVFPNVSAGNIGYKIAQRLGGAAAFGPILQGLAAPVNDLSRGCSAQDVVTVALISALQSLPAREPVLDPA